jgi:hypothetical protein
LFYKEEIYQTARKLKEVIRISQLDKFLNLIVKNRGWNGIANHLGQDSSAIEKHFRSFDKLPAFMEVLEGIINLQCKTTCQESGGCSIGGVTHKCEALKCINEKGFEGCWQCGEFKNCEKLSFLRKNYGETIDGNLEIIKNEGVEAVKSRGNEYYAWQRR